VSEFIFGIVFALVLSPLYVPIIVISVCVVQAAHWWRASLEDANSAVNRLRAALSRASRERVPGDDHRPMTASTHLGGADSPPNFSRPAAEPA
jgi:hypothetical protein